jgi:hypothetical protein
METNGKPIREAREFVPETRVDLGRIPDHPTGGRHEMHFVDCCKNGGKPASSFDYAGPFNEMVVLGNLAIRLQSLKKTLIWDSENMKVTNIGEKETIRTAHLSPYGSDVVTRRVDRNSKQWVEQNAMEMASEWIKHNYQNGWSLPELS